MHTLTRTLLKIISVLFILLLAALILNYVWGWDPVLLTRDQMQKGLITLIILFVVIPLVDLVLPKKN